MNLRFIINTVIIVLILHFILENIDLKIDIGASENFSIKKLNENESLKFLTENTVEEFDPRQDIIDYINNKSNDVRGLNFYKTDYNTPHFNSNVTDVHSFYNINYDMNDCTHGGFDGINLHNVMNSKDKSKTCENYKNLDNKHQNVAPAYQPEQWHYKGELPMNGGLQDGVVGYTKIEADFAPFPNKDTFLEPNKFQKCTGKTFDLRYDRQNYQN